MAKKPDPDKWERVDHRRVSLTNMVGVKPKYMMTYENGRVVYWKRKK